MALLTTTKSMGWYGVHSPSECVEFSLPEHFGTYNANGQFQVGKSGLSESEAKQLIIWTMTPAGQPWTWDLGMESSYRNNPNLVFLLANLESFKCGQIYWITWTGTQDLNVPGFVPSALGVDMGRVTA